MRRAKKKESGPLAKRQYSSVDYKDISQDKVHDLLRDINDGSRDAKDLTANSRRACLMFVANGKRSVSDLASIFKVSRITINKDLAHIRMEMGAKVKEWGLNHILGQLSINAERFMTMALKEHDVGLAWTIQRDLAKLLKDFGVGQEVTKKDDSFKVTIESVGGGYERATELLYKQFTMDPAMTGEVIDVPAAIEGKLPLNKKFPNPPKQDPGIEIEVSVPKFEEQE